MRGLSSLPPGNRQASVARSGLAAIAGTAASRRLIAGARSLPRYSTRPTLWDASRGDLPALEALSVELGSAGRTAGDDDREAGAGEQLAKVGCRLVCPVEERDEAGGTCADKSQAASRSAFLARSSAATFSMRVPLSSLSSRSGARQHRDEGFPVLLPRAERFGAQRLIELPEGESLAAAGAGLDHGDLRLVRSRKELLVGAVGCVLLPEAVLVLTSDRRLAVTVPAVLAPALHHEARLHPCPD